VLGIALALHNVAEPNESAGVRVEIEGEASTAAAQAALPASYSRPDAVYNVGRVALLVAAWTQGRFDLVGRAMGDRLHRP
jgi:homoserine kinase